MGDTAVPAAAAGARLPTPPNFDPDVQRALDEAKTLIAADRISDALARYRLAYDGAIAKGDHFHACVIAHMAGVAESDPKKKHDWNLAALRHADGAPDVTGSRGMYASLYNNLGMSHLLLGKRDRARECFERAAARVAEIGTGPYADRVRAGIERNLARSRG